MLTAASAETTESESLLLKTLSNCRSADEWIAAIQANPGAGSLTSYSTEDAQELLNLACMRATDTPACIDASSKNLLTFDLDDPRLEELQAE